MKSGFAFFRQQVAPALVCFGLAAAVAPWLQRFENVTLDARAFHLARFQPPPDPAIVIVAIDDESVETIGRWPFERKYHGILMALAADAKPSVMAWDILFTEPDEVNPDNDLKLIQGANTARVKGTEVVFGAVTNPEPGQESPSPRTKPVQHIEGDVAKIPGNAAVLAPLADLQERANFGIVNTPPGPDGTRRIVPLLGRGGDRVYFSLSLETLLRHWKVPPADVRVRLGDGIYFRADGRDRRIPIDETGGYLVNYRFGFEQSRRLPYAGMMRFLDEVFVQKTPDVKLPDLRGKILLVGLVSTALTDNGPTPFGGHTPLVLVHANVINNILREDYARRVAPGWVLLGGLVVGVGGLALFSQRKLLVQGGFSLGVPLLYAGVAVLAWVKFNLWLPLVWPVLGFTALQIFTISRRLIAEQRAKEQIKGMFGAYLSPTLVNRLVAAGQMPRLGGHEAEITAYFSDIQSFSTFSEKLPPDRLVELMNEYLTACTDIVQEEGGTLDKYIGDAVVVMFGAPIDLADHAARACIAAVRVQEKLAELRAKWKAEGDRWPEIVRRMQSRIGLNTGPCVVGNMGSRVRFNYTMMGDNVNLGARMESGAKHWGVFVMCTEATKHACEAHAGDRVVFRSLGRIVVMGRASAVPFFEVVGLRESIPSTTRECVAEFEAGLAKYFARDWSGAEAAWQRSAELEPNVPGKTPGVKTNPSLIYLERARRCAAAPPPESWDGTELMSEK